MARTRNTAQKTAVLNAVRKAEHHPDATWVYDHVKEELSGISLGTVYRVLSGLCQEGLVREYRQVDGPTLYDMNTQDHFHVRCTTCGRICDVPNHVLPSELAERVREASQFADIDAMRVEFFGRCRRCSQVN